MIKQVNNVPVMPQIMGHAALLAGEPVQRYATDALTMYRCQLAAWEFYGYDAVFPAADHSIEAEALGSILHYYQDNYPALERPALAEITRWEKLSLPDPHRHGRMPVTVEACRMLRRSLGEQVLVIPKIMGPMSIAGQVLGLEKLLTSIVERPEAVKELLRFTTEVAMVYGKALLQAGAHSVLIYDPIASQQIMPINIFRQMELPNLKSLFAGLKEAGSQMVWFQIWSTSRFYPIFRELGCDMVTIDSHLDLAEAMASLPGLLITGNIASFAFVEENTSEIERLAKNCLASVEGEKRYILGAGCEIPLEARAENILALVKTVRKTGPLK
ncbi:Uroporphyrinogen decarboxylase (URO-D) [Moorella glycerini]|uniref:Methylcobalamin:coenzyme M methyltransferase n=1 Tax=Neomoorella stamsii TaxID=1266720 RepID=A0A9X7J4W7_9FIRM|nr:MULTISPECIES: uroporphyrinogen decarboxylase family protein [Moorella]PRR74352.1 methylcobalamin:coenzyme M methyltransferase [Moorella stamsii]CEP66759.1 Uroporphyrinogen decarboxylase (URO-D) [Moorella glycerini]